MKKRFSVMLTMLLMITMIIPIRSNAYGSVVIIPVPTKTQGTKTNWCWACCGAACVQYTTGNSTTKEMFSIAVKGNSTNNQTATAQDVIDGLDYFGVSSYIMQSPMSFTLIKYNIGDVERPVIAGLYLSNGSDSFLHMVTIKGYGEINGVANQKTISYMDPMFSSTQMESYADLKNGYILSGTMHCQWIQTIHQIHN